MAESTDISQAFAKSLRHYRLLRKLSQEELADAAGLDRTYISMLERSIKSPSLRSMYLIARQLDVPLAELVGHAEAQLKNK